MLAEEKEKLQRFKRYQGGREKFGKWSCTASISIDPDQPTFTREVGKRGMYNEHYQCKVKASLPGQVLPLRYCHW